MSVPGEAPTLPRPWFFSLMSAVVLGAVAVGFGRTYWAPLLAGTFRGPAAVHVHGAFALAWVLLFAVQPLLVRWRRLAWHRRIGQLGLPVALGVSLTMLPAGMYQATRDAQAGAGATGISTLLGVLNSAVLFTAMVAAGIATRRDRESHARWMLLATIFVAWPAWFRFRHWFPAVPRPDLWFGLVLALAWVPVAMWRDRVTRGRVHPVLAWGGTALVAEQCVEVLLFDSPPWRAAAAWLYAMLGGAA